MHGHLIEQTLHPALRGDNTLHVIGVVSNPVRYRSRWRLARQWRAEMEATPNVHVHLVEAAFGDRHHEIANDSDGDLQVRTDSEIWIKENLINLGVRYTLPRDWKYVAWIDADVSFRDPTWAQETLHQLQHYPVVQPWQSCADLGPDGEIMQSHSSFGYLTQRGVRIQRWTGEPYQYGHSGFAWACRRDFWEQAQGLMDFAILGSADHHMAWAMIGDVDSTIHRGMSAPFFRLCHEWQARVVRSTNKHVGFTTGRIEHHFHGRKTRRQYRERWQILIDSGFNPDRDLVRDSQGLIRLANRPEIEEEIRHYNRSRMEDSIDPD